MHAAGDGTQEELGQLTSSRGLARADDRIRRAGPRGEVRRHRLRERQESGRRQSMKGDLVSGYSP